METVGDYRLGRVLGKGGFSEVRLGTHLPTRKQYAVKVLERNSAINSDERIRGPSFAYSLPHAPSPHAQGSSGVVATMLFVWRGHTEEPHHSGRVEP